MLKIDSQVWNRLYIYMYIFCHMSHSGIFWDCSSAISLLIPLPSTSLLFFSAILLYSAPILHPQKIIRQLEHLIKLRTKGEEVLSSRLSHAQEDLQRAVERAERAEAHISAQEQEIAGMRE